MLAKTELRITQVNVISHTFQCGVDDIKLAEEKGEDLIRAYGIDEVMSHVEFRLNILASEDDWEGYEDMALVKFILKEKYFSEV